MIKKIFIILFILIIIISIFLIAIKIIGDRTVVDKEGMINNINESENIENSNDNKDTN